MFENKPIVRSSRVWRCWVPSRSIPHVFSAARTVGRVAASFQLWRCEMFLMLNNLALLLLILSILSPVMSTKISLKDGEHGWDAG